MYFSATVVTDRDFGGIINEQHNVLIHRFIWIPRNPGECLMRCGINATNRYTIISHKHYTMYIWRIPPEVRH